MADVVDINTGEKVTIETEHNPAYYAVKELLATLNEANERGELEAVVVTTIETNLSCGYTTAIPLDMPLAVCVGAVELTRHGLSSIARREIVSRDQ